MAKFIPDMTNLQFHVLGVKDEDVLDLTSDARWVDVSSWGSVEVKRDWVYTDPTGHNHDYFTYQHSTYQPTAEVHCEDCHEAHDENDGPRRCRWCDEPVEPDYMSVGAYAQQIKGAESHYLVTAVPVMLGALAVHHDRVYEVVGKLPGDISYGETKKHGYVLASVGKRHHTNDGGMTEYMHFGRHERKTDD